MDKVIITVRACKKPQRSCSTASSWWDSGKWSRSNASFLVQPVWHHTHFIQSYFCLSQPQEMLSEVWTLLDQDSDCNWSGCWISHSQFLLLWLERCWTLVCDASDSSCGSVLGSDKCRGCSSSSDCCSAWTSDFNVSFVCWDLLRLWVFEGSCGCFDRMLDSGWCDDWHSVSLCSCLCSSSALCANMMLTFLWWASSSSLSFSYSRKHQVRPLVSSSPLTISRTQQWITLQIMSTWLKMP